MGELGCLPIPSRAVVESPGGTGRDGQGLPIRSHSRYPKEIGRPTECDIPGQALGSSLRL
jgi:hypothetical protein